LLVLGIADLGRFALYGIGVTQAARDGALYAARNPTASDTQLTTRACAEMKLAVSCGDVRATRLGDSSSPGPGLVARVRVEYRFTLITAFIADRIGATNLTLSAEATQHGYTQ
jgi:Flp pilus assembly protein TadG